MFRKQRRNTITANSRLFVDFHCRFLLPFLSFTILMAIDVLDVKTRSLYTWSIIACEMVQQRSISSLPRLDDSCSNAKLESLNFVLIKCMTSYAFNLCKHFVSKLLKTARKFKFSGYECTSRAFGLTLLIQKIMIQIRVDKQNTCNHYNSGKYDTSD